MRPSWKSLLLGLVVAVTLFSAATQADAGWYWGARPFYVGWGGYGGWGGGCCGSPCYTVSYCDPCCDSGWYWGCRAHRCGARWHAVGCCCSSCYVDPCCGVASCCGDVTVNSGVLNITGSATTMPPPPAGATTPTKAPPAPAPGTGTGTGTGGIGGLPSPDAPSLPGGGAASPEPAKPADKRLFDDGPAAPPAKPNTGGGLEGPVPSPPGGSRTSLGPTQSDSGLLTVYCPATAKVTINGMPTRATGSKRQFVSFGLTSGYTYKYTVVAAIVRDGQVVEEAQTVTLTAGDRNAVAFGFNPATAEGIAAN